MVILTKNTILLPSILYTMAAIGGVSWRCLGYPIRTSRGNYGVQGPSLDISFSAINKNSEQVGVQTRAVEAFQESTDLFPRSVGFFHGATRPYPWSRLHVDRQRSDTVETGLPLRLAACPEGCASSRASRWMFRYQLSFLVA